MNISTLTNTEGTKSVKEAAPGLLVHGYRRQKVLKLPTCIRQSKIPNNANDIPSAMSVQDWPHLQHLAKKLISVEEGNKLELMLLIGSNLPQVFISRHDIAKGDREPFARLTDLGWTLMGNITSETNQKVVANHVDAVVNRAVAAPFSRSNITFKVKPETQ
ncbi:uncharacterized protein [Watersipora subatra]|uniref:uncharacterized protein n=1 Tax=Watersipora subatra TaxID=2589382 RepID=UPI00355C72F5